jgi:putative ABC transport system permease protein
MKTDISRKTVVMARPSRMSPNIPLSQLVMRRSVVQLIGLLLAIAASGALAPVLYHVDPRDQIVFGGVAVVSALASLIASFLPARRVTRIDPVAALAVE